MVEATDIPMANAPDPTVANPEVNSMLLGEKSSTAASGPDDTVLVQPKKTCESTQGR